VANADRLDDWLTPPDPTPNGWSQQRGYALERIIRHLLAAEGLQPKLTNIRPTGEEIDGSFVFNECTFLFEAKWRKDPVPASDFYAFKGKVDGKLVGTIGVFVSMTGFARDAVDALKFGKEINLILFNGSDFKLIANGKMTFVDALRAKLRYAAEEGQPFLPLTDGPDSIADNEPEEAETAVTPAPSRQPGKANIVVEGAADRDAVRILLNRLDPALLAQTQIWSAGGSLNVASLMRQLSSAGAGGLAVVVDGDNAAMEQLVEIRSLLEEIRGYLLVVSPSLEDQLENAIDVDLLNMMPPTAHRKKIMRRFARNADLDRLFEHYRGFAGLIDWLRRAVDDGGPSTPTQ